MKDLKKIWYLSFVALFTCVGFASPAIAQNRERVVKTVSSQPINQPNQQTPVDRPRTLSSSAPVNAPPIRPTLTNKLVVAAPPVNKESLVKKTVSSHSLTGAMAASQMRYGASATGLMQRAIQSRLGIPYRYGSTGPNRYDCSGFVWQVFTDAGMGFTRQSARTIWAMSEPVAGDERYKFGTLVFLNGLGHMGIVADENGFYHASSSKGITYSPFKGYWEKRITGFRKLNAALPVFTPSTK